MVAERLSLGLLAGLILLANLLPGDTMELQRTALAQGQLWRLWTGQFCHWSATHLAGNLAAGLALWIVAGPRLRPWLALLPVLAPLLSAALLATAPWLESYRGFSGLGAVLVVGVAIEGGLLGQALAAAYVAKLVVDAAGDAASVLLPAGIVTAWPAHLGGLLLGLATAALLRHARRRSDSPAAPAPVRFDPSRPPAGNGLPAPATLDRTPA